MAGRWNSQRGDEWWYSGGSAVAEGMAGPTMFEITRIAGAPIGANALHELLAQTLDQFPDEAVYVLLDGTTRPALVSLATDERVVWQELKQPFSVSARILAVVPPNAAV